MKPRSWFKRPFRHFRHSMLMIKKNKVVYSKLSITVVLSFSLLLAFLLFTDARLYNEYKEIFSQSREIVLCNIYGKPASYHALLSQVRNNFVNTDYYGYITIDGTCQYENGNTNARCAFLPNGDVPVYSWKRINVEKANNIYSVTPIELLGDKNDFYLSGNEVIINEGWYNSLVDGGAKYPLYIPIQFDWQKGGSSYWELKVVGICSDTPQEALQLNKAGSVYGWGRIYLSAELLSRDDIGEFNSSTEYSVWLNTNTPEKAISHARALGFSTYGVSEAQETANIIIAVEKANKAYIAAIILVLMSINLYSSFSNALKERRYEIGVKRALGANKIHIVRQFLYESISVLLFDTLFSTSLVVSIMIGYKTYQAFIMNNEWIVYISSYSVIIFLVCSLSLSIVFSLIFAFQSMQVEIISNLREE